MKIHTLAVAVAIITLLSSCSQYIVSPLNTTANPYTPVPVKQKDEANKTETFVGVGLTPGGLTVSEYNDFFNYGSLRLAQSHAFGSFRASYSGNFMLGAAHIDENGYNSGSDEDFYRQKNGGNLSFGSAGLNGTLCVAIPFKSGKGEWRAIGLQGSVANEFGEYLTFRKNFPVTGDEYIDSKSVYWSAGLFTEFVRLLRNDKFFGMKFAGSFSVFPNPWNDEGDPYKNELPDNPRYLSITPFMGKGNGSGFIQVNFGTTVMSMQIGFLLNVKAFKKKEE